MKRGNDYAAAFGPLYSDTPKAVFAAVAMSYCSAGGDDLKNGIAQFLNEWRNLYDNGIVPQHPPHAQAEEGK